MRRIVALLLTVSLIFALSGCFLLKSSKSGRKQLTTYFDENAEVVAARVWYEDNESGETVIIEASEDEIDALVEEINKTKLSSHFAHADYFYKGFYGLEMTLSDGTYLIYDCTELEISDVPFDEKESRYDSVKDQYLEDVNKDFWDRIEPYFPGMDTQSFSYGWL